MNRGGWRDGYCRRRASERTLGTASTCLRRQHILPLVPSGNEVLARLRTARLAPNVPKPPAGQERTQQPAAFARTGAETICATTAAGLNHKLSMDGAALR